MTFDKSQFLEEVKNDYLQSHDYNGLPIREVKTRYGLNTENLRELLPVLIMDDKVSLVFDTNPHIKRFPLLEKEEQINKLQTEAVEGACLYPANDYLKQAVDPSLYTGRPYDFEMALGGNQIDFRVFDLAILESYRNDPRYYYETNDIGGRICVRDEHYQSEEMHEKDKVHLQTFGFCYDQNDNRGVAVFLRYLKGLSPDHQQMWKLKELSGEWQLHPDYYRSAILGSWDRLNLSIFDACIEELKLLNKMSELMGRPSLFKETFERNRPKDFSFLIRPTRQEFNQFVKTLDKLLSENINKKFFKGEITDKFEDGSPKGTVTMLEEWLEKFYKTQEPLKELFSVFREIRKIRSKDAHHVIENEFSQQFVHEQRELIIKVYDTLSILRQIMHRHPDVRNADLKISEHLQNRKIWTQ